MKFIRYFYLLFLLVAIVASFFITWNNLIVVIAGLMIVFGLLLSFKMAWLNNDNHVFVMVTNFLLIMMVAHCLQYLNQVYPGQLSMAAITFYDTLRLLGVQLMQLVDLTDLLRQSQIPIAQAQGMGARLVLVATNLFIGYFLLSCGFKALIAPITRLAPDRDAQKELRFIVSKLLLVLSVFLLVLALVILILKVYASYVMLALAGVAIITGFIKEQADDQEKTFYHFLATMQLLFTAILILSWRWLGPIVFFSGLCAGVMALLFYSGRHLRLQQLKGRYFFLVWLGLFIGYMLTVWWVQAGFGLNSHSPWYYASTEFGKAADLSKAIYIFEWVKPSTGDIPLLLFITALYRVMIKLVFFMALRRFLLAVGGGGFLSIEFLSDSIVDPSLEVKLRKKAFDKVIQEEPSLADELCVNLLEITTSPMQAHVVEHIEKKLNQLTGIRPDKRLFWAQALERVLPKVRDPKLRQRIKELRQKINTQLKSHESKAEKIGMTTRALGTMKSTVARQQVVDVARRKYQTIYERFLQRN